MRSWRPNCRSDVIGTGTNAWSYLVLEGENFVSKENESLDAGFGKVYADEALTDTYGTPILGTNTTASGKGALFTKTQFAQWTDKATYQVQFTTPGTYYLYMRFTMFENGGNVANYGNEDSYFLPPDFDKDPQNDWGLIGPSGRTGGYVEGCCADAGFLRIAEVGTGGIPRVDHSTDTNYWEGNFHWNDLISSQFLAADTGVPNVRFKYEVTADKVGHPLNFTIGYREGGLAVDLFLFSTHPNLIDVYTQGQLDQLLLPSTGQPQLTIAVSGTSVVVSWPVAATGYRLVSAGTLSAPVWTPVTTPPVVVVGDKNTVTLTGVTGTQYYRLMK